MKFTVRGDTWKCKIAKIKDFGLCEYDIRTIWLSKNQSYQEVLDTFFHEFCHAYFPDLNEECVIEFAEDLTEAICTLHGDKEFQEIFSKKLFDK